MAYASESADRGITEATQEIIGGMQENAPSAESIIVDLTGGTLQSSLKMLDLRPHPWTESIYDISSSLFRLGAALPVEKIIDVDIETETSGVRENEGDRIKAYVETY